MHRLFRVREEKDEVMPHYESERWKHAFLELKKWAKARENTKLSPYYHQAIKDLQQAIKVISDEWSLPPK